MDNKEALDLAILAINTIQFPEATNDDDFYLIDEIGAEAIVELCKLRASILRGLNDSAAGNFDPNNPVCPVCNADVVVGEQQVVDYNLIGEWTDGVYIIEEAVDHETVESFVFVSCTSCDWKDRDAQFTSKF